MLRKRPRVEKIDLPAFSVDLLALVTLPQLASDTKTAFIPERAL